MTRRSRARLRRRSAALIALARAEHLALRLVRCGSCLRDANVAAWQGQPLAAGCEPGCTTPAAVRHAAMVLLRNVDVPARRAA